MPSGRILVGMTGLDESLSGDRSLHPTAAAEPTQHEAVAARVRWSDPEQVFRAHYARLVDALSVAAADREVAADAVQEAFVRLVASWPRISRYDDPVAWVRRVALNQVFDYRRLLLRRAGAVARLARQRREPETPADFGPVVPDEVLSLSGKQRTAIALHYVAGLTIPEVAKAMGVSEGSVNRHLHRARQSLRSEWSDHE
ncbi:MAG: sigma-70 family RNA polymerase sigma factor [Armatimonadetes bacterium]|nr:sigma-70 family RNA polymerase sigma factor [Armatimonadota bacterium]